MPPEIPPQRCPHDGGRCHMRCNVDCYRQKRGHHLAKPEPGFPKEGVLIPVLESDLHHG